MLEAIITLIVGALGGYWFAHSGFGKAETKRWNDQLDVEINALKAEAERIGETDIKAKILIAASNLVSMKK